MSTTTNHKRTRLIALVTALLVVAGILGIAPKAAMAKDASSGDLVVTKTFEGGEGNEEASFTVAPAAGSTVTLPKSYTISGGNRTQPETVNLKGDVVTSITFKLKDKETFTLAGVPAGKLTVKEDQVPTGFTASISVKEEGGEAKEDKVTSADVEINVNKTMTVAFTNAKETTNTETNNNNTTTDTTTEEGTSTDEKGNLTISKKVSLSKTEEAIQKAEGDSSTLQKLNDRIKDAQSEKFTFTVTLRDISDNVVEGEYDYTAIRAGKEVTGKIKSGDTFQLAHDDKITITGLPDQTFYNVAESEADNWKPDRDWKIDVVHSGETKEAAFINTALGALKISKTTESASGSELSGELKEQEFSFKVTLKDEYGNDVKDYFKYSGDAEGVMKSGDTIKLKGGQDVTIKNLPAGITAEVEEESAGQNWKPSTEKQSLVIDEYSPTEAAFTNTYTSTPTPTPTPTPTGTGDLKISKTVSLPKTDEAIKEAEAGSSALERLENRLKQAQSDQFTFVVNLLDASDKPVEGEFNYTGTLAGKEVTGKIKNGGTVDLAHNDSVTITGLPEGTKYTVTENKVDNWKVDEESKKGTISSNGAADASFTNTALGALKISKTIKSASGTELSDDLKATEFSFIVTFKEGDNDVAGEFAYTGSKEGSIKSGDTITLKGGESVTFPNLKVGITARVEEVQVDYWQANAKALKGDIVEYSARTASFTNTYQDTTTSSSNSGRSNYSNYSSGSYSPTTRTATTGTTTTRATTPATSDDTNVVVPVALGAIAVGLVVASRVVRSKE